MTIQIQIHESQNWRGQRYEATTRDEAIKVAGAAIAAIGPEARAALFDLEDADYHEWVGSTGAEKIYISDNCNFEVLRPARELPATFSPEYKK